jgi:hypothetical protein
MSAEAHSSPHGARQRQKVLLVPDYMGIFASADLLLAERFVIWLGVGQGGQQRLAARGLVEGFRPEGVGT